MKKKNHQQRYVIEIMWTDTKGVIHQIKTYEIGDAEKDHRTIAAITALKGTHN